MHADFCLERVQTTLYRSKVSAKMRQNSFWSKTHTCITVLCKSNANDNRRISRFVLSISRWYINEKSHRSVNAKTINQRDIGTIFTISRRDIGLAILHCNDISQSETIYCHDISLQRSSLWQYIVVNLASTIYRSEVIVYNKSVFVYICGRNVFQ